MGFVEMLYKYGKVFKLQKYKRNDVFMFPDSVGNSLAFKQKISKPKWHYASKTITKKKTTDSRKKSVVKAITFRIIATMATAATFFLFTGNIGLSVGFGAVDFITKLALYYAHERAWITFESKSDLFKQAIAVCGIKF